MSTDVYRKPAEDEHAKLDAVEIAAFQATMAAAKRRQRVRVGCALALGFVVLGGVGAFVALRRDERAMHRDPSCHIVYDVTPELRKPREIVVCAPLEKGVVP